MKKFLMMVWLMFLFTGTACSQNHQGFIVKGKLTGVTDERLMFSKNIKGSRPLPININEDGTFEIKDVLDNEDVIRGDISLMKVRMGKNGGMAIQSLGTISLFLQNGDAIEINGDIKESEFLKISGNKYNDDLTEFAQAIKSKKRKYNKLISEQKNLKNSGDSDFEKRKTDLAEKVETARKQFVKLLQVFLRKNPDNYANDLVLFKYRNILEADELQIAYNSLNKNKQNSVNGQGIVNAIQFKQQKKKAQTGKPAPDFAKIDKEGNLIRLSDFKGKKYVLLDFWGSW